MMFRFIQAYNILMLIEIVVLAIALVYVIGLRIKANHKKKTEAKCARCGCVIKEPKYGMKHLSLSDTVEEEDIDLCEDCFKAIFKKRENDDV